MNTETLTIVTSVVAIVISVYAIWKATTFGTPITSELVQATLATSTTMATELTEVGLTAARAAQQLFETGKIARDERLNYAFTYVKQWFPDLDQARILTAIEAGVYVINTISESLPEKKISGGTP